MDGTVLVADDDRTIRTVLTQALTRAGCKVHATASMVTLMRWVEEGRGDMVISDVIMPDGNGLESLPKINELRPDLPVIIISAQNTIMTAIQATEASAYDYLPKPFDLPDLMKRTARALEQKVKTGADIKPASAMDDLPLVGRTPAMQEIYRVVARVLRSDLPVLLSGESGTGKSLIARVLHDYSDRRSLPYVVVGASELTGAGSSIRALAKAGSGTIVFDEVGDLSEQAQSELVRALDQMGDNAPRLTSTSQIDLAELAKEGHFRQDLLFRLNAVSLTVPPLRARLDDIEPLVEFFLAGSTGTDEVVKSLNPEALELMRHAYWAGNVRQLENMIRRLVATSAQMEIEAQDTRLALGDMLGTAVGVGIRGGEKLGQSIKSHLQHYFDLHGADLPPDGLYQRILREMEQPLIELTLDATGGNQAKCAEVLGINRNTLRKKITELDIRVTRRRKLM